jgi:hypothetical protein
MPRMLAAAGGLGVLALILGLVAYFQKRKLDQMSGTATLSCHSATSAPEGPCEVVGRAVAGPQGVLEAPRSKLKAVWYEYKITHVHTVEERDSDGTETRRKRRDTIHHDKSEAPFYVEDESGRILVEHRGNGIHEPQETADDIEETLDPRFGGSDDALGKLGQVLDRLDDDTYEHKEHILPEGAQVYVFGQLKRGSDGMVFSDKKLKVSTRSEEELSAAAKRWYVGSAAAAGLSLVGALILLALGL